jgi:hypothetical protein
MELLKKIWKDPVGSKIITAIIIPIIFFICTFIYSQITNKSLNDVSLSILNYQLKTWAILAIIFIVYLLRYTYIKWIKRNFKYNVNTLTHDKELYDNIINKILPATGSISFIRTNNFAGFAFNLDNLDDIDNFYDKKDDPNYEFENPAIEAIRKKLLKNIDIFEDLIGFETFSTHNNFQTVPPEWETNDPERFWKVVNAIHDSTREICGHYDDLVRMGRKLIN